MKFRRKNKTITVAYDRIFNPDDHYHLCFAQVLFPSNIYDLCPYIARHDPNDCFAIGFEKECDKCKYNCRVDTSTDNFVINADSQIINFFEV